MSLTVSASGITFNDLTTLSTGSISAANIAVGSIGTLQLSANSVTTSKIAFDGGSFFFRNRIINGDMRIDQRNNGSSISIAALQSLYPVDRWQITSYNSSLSAQRVGVPGSYSIQLSGAPGNTSANIFQKIESHNIADLAGQTVTVSVTLASTITNTAVLYYYTPTAQDNFAVLNPIQTIGSTNSITSTPTRFSFTFNLQAAATNGVYFVLVTGALTSGTFNISNVQLEKGPTATPFEYRPIGTELSLCQRYFEVLNTPGIQASGIGGATVTANWLFKVTKRTTPQVTGWTGTSPSIGIDSALTQNTAATALWAAGSTASAEL